MKKRRLMAVTGIVLVFILGGLAGAYMTATLQTLSLLEKADIRNNCVDIRRSIFYLELLKKDKRNNLLENFEWDIDQGLIGVSQYVGKGGDMGRLDFYALGSIKMAREYRLSNPRSTKVPITDKIVASVLNGAPSAPGLIVPRDPGKDME